MMMSGTKFSMMQLQRATNPCLKPSILHFSHFVIFTVGVFLKPTGKNGTMISSMILTHHFNLDKITQEEEDSVRYLYTKEQALLQEELDFNVDELWDPQLININI